MDTPFTPNPEQAVARLLGLLQLEEVETDLFRSQSTDEGWIRVYGGQVVAQALMAASLTVEEGRLCHSLHSYFIRPGDPKLPIVYKVERDRDGASFTTRRIVAIQKGRPIFNMAASFQAAEAGLEHAVSPPSDVPHPDGLESDSEWARRNAPNAPEPWRTLWLTRERPLDVRAVESDEDFFNPQKRPPQQRHWVRLASPLTPEQAADPVLQRCLFAYASDMTLLDTCLAPHGISWANKALQSASLDHAIWFNQTPDMNDWHLFDQDSPMAGGGRGINRAIVHDINGRPIATLMQEGLIRYRP
ncbi:acyl-CoA thioesterase II [Sandarakinorhabdus sp. AAP62]|uniref:acyl-CoA thioesterase n=1 Tax=Sandarakinorhabdus sp. AAP62 TaxID=1248916 RepID=UPI0002F33FD2|nr:acyl-CoA thioesterase II [Sandarakinorhabdus sp. AAP62]